MYYIVYTLLYLLSLLPLRILYLFSDLLYLLIYRLIGYRKKVVMQNLLIAFPDKSEHERKKIASDFYHNFIDNFIEIIKLLSWNSREVNKRFAADLTGMQPAFDSGRNIHLIGMHNFNWELCTWGMTSLMSYPFIGIYMPVGSATFDRIMLRLRSRYGATLIPATSFRKAYAPYIHQQHVLGSVADQSPGNPSQAYWLYFFGRPTAFVTGPEKNARLQNAAVVFAHFYKVKRGYYKFDTKFITEAAADMPAGELTRQYVSFVENCLRKQPANYLWSHRRWKKEWKADYLKKWIDTSPPPVG
ncbi:MAG TPA: lysophospholipid acyltransferase family protein [Chitinophagaceae bacterium]|nr:lysophospholipid acyltransferase family protein [Chitinophagaceae bacterium]